MTRAESREQRWLRRGIGALLVLAFALFAITTYSVIQTANDRAAAANRAERTAAELHVLAERLDQQAAALDRQAAALEDQADALQSSADRADRSRAQFRAAAREILEQLGSDLDAFELADPSTAPAPTPPSPRRPASEPGTEPSSQATADEITEPAPGCAQSGDRPPRCQGN